MERMTTDKHPLKTMKGLIGAVLGAAIWLIAQSVLGFYGSSPVMSLVYMILGMGIGAVAVGTIFASSGKSRRKALIGAFIGLVAAIVVGLLSYYSVLQLIALAIIWAIIGAYLLPIIYKK